MFQSVRKEIKHDRIVLVAAGAAFFAFLSLFPAMIALISLYGIFTHPGRVEEQLEEYMGAVPPPAAELLQEQMQRIAEGAPNALGWGAILGIVVALWSANKGMKAMVSSLNVAYGLREDRNFFRLNVVTLGLTAGAILFVILVLTLSAAIPVILGPVGLGDAAARLITISRWPLLGLIVLVAVSSLYRWAPSRPSPHWRWVTPGAVTATLLFLLTSTLMSLYIRHFGDYGEVYGSVTAVAILMLWLLASAVAIVLGAELNAAIEREKLSAADEG